MMSQSGAPILVLNTNTKRKFGHKVQLENIAAGKIFSFFQCWNNKAILSYVINSLKKSWTRVLNSKKYPYHYFIFISVTWFKCLNWLTIWYKVLRYLFVYILYLKVITIKTQLFLWVMTTSFLTCIKTLSINIKTIMYLELINI